MTDLIKRLRTKHSSLVNQSFIMEEAADRIEELVKDRDEAWKRAAHSEKMWGEAEVKLAKAVEALRETDQAIMFHTDETGWRLWGEGAVSDIRKVLAELEKEC